MSAALLCIDYINDIVSEGGKLSSKGYLSFVDEHGTLRVVSALQARCRESGVTVLHVRVGFDPSYLNHPKMSPLFGTAEKFGALTLGSWGTEFADQVSPLDSELTFAKPRVSAFYGTGLESALRSLGVSQLLIAGVATDLAVQAAARDAHDRDFQVTVVSDACAAATASDHDNSLATLAKISRVLPAAELEL
jgi:nicotinamidase-related amidase